MGKAVVLLSGGLDSATTLFQAKQQGYECVALTILYGQRHRVEIEAAKRIASQAGIQDHHFARVDLDLFGGSALTDDIEVPKDRVGEAIPVTYVPARNTVFLSIALALAEACGALDIFIGANAVDYSGYPDCRPEFIQSFEQTANMATKSGVEGRRFKIHAPLLSLTKAQIIALGREMGLDHSLTHSCYDPDDKGRACGHCDSCIIRKRAFEELGFPDPALAHLADV